MSQPSQLFTLEPDGPHPLDLEAWGGSAEAAYERFDGGVYEGLRTFDGVRLFELDAHLERLEQGRASHALGPPLDEGALRRALHAALVARAAHGSETKLRLDLLPPGRGPRLVLALHELSPVPDAILRDGAPLVREPSLVRDHAQHKGSAFALERRRVPFPTPQCYEPLLVDDQGRALEGAMSSFAALIDGELVTPAKGVLPGITLARLVTLAAACGIPTRWAPIAEGELARAEEAFLSSSVRGCVPVTSIDGVPVGAGRPGPVVRGLGAAWLACARSEARPASSPDSPAP